MVEKKKFITFVTPKFRMNFPKLFAAESYAGGEPKYKVEMLVKKSDYAKWKPIKDYVDSLIKEIWPKGVPKNFLYPFKDGDTEKPGNASYGDHMYANAKRAEKLGQPLVFDAAKQEVIDPAEAYSGRWAKAIISVYAYTKGSQGVSFGLQKIQLLDHDEPIGGSRDTSADGFEIEEEVF